MFAWFFNVGGHKDDHEKVLEVKEDDNKGENIQPVPREPEELHRRGNAASGGLRLKQALPFHGFLSSLVEWSETVETDRRKLTELKNVKKYNTLLWSLYIIYFPRKIVLVWKC